MVSKDFHHREAQSQVVGRTDTQSPTIEVGKYSSKDLHCREAQSQIVDGVGTQKSYERCRQPEALHGRHTHP